MLFFWTTWKGFSVWGHLRRLRNWVTAKLTMHFASPLELIFRPFCAIWCCEFAVNLRREAISWSSVYGDFMRSFFSLQHYLPVLYKLCKLNPFPTVLEGWGGCDFDSDEAEWNHFTLQYSAFLTKTNFSAGIYCSLLTRFSCNVLKSMLLKLQWMWKFVIYIIELLMNH